jgi:hypothetical protein
MIDAEPGVGEIATNIDRFRVLANGEEEASWASRQ